MDNVERTCKAPDTRDDVGLGFESWTIICAWCGTALARVGTGAGAADEHGCEPRVTHGICPPCERRLEAEMQPAT